MIDRGAVHTGSGQRGAVRKSEEKWTLILVRDCTLAG